MKFKTIRNNQLICEENITREIYQVIRKTIENDNNIKLIESGFSPCGNMVFYYKDNGDKIRLVFEF